MNFDEWRKKRDGVPPEPRKRVSDLLNTSHSDVCYIFIRDFRLDEQDNFWIRRAAFFEERIPREDMCKGNWIAVSCFNYGGKVHTNANENWGDIEVVSQPDPKEWVRVYPIGG